MKLAAISFHKENTFLKRAGNLKLNFLFLSLDVTESFKFLNDVMN